MTDTKRVRYNLSPELTRDIRVRAAELGVSSSALAETLLRFALIKVGGGQVLAETLAEARASVAQARAERDHLS